MYSLQVIKKKYFQVSCDRNQPSKLRSRIPTLRGRKGQPSAPRVLLFDTIRLLTKEVLSAFLSVIL
jgi:hypothetical protein